MIHLIVLFFVALIGITLRYFIVGEFELNQLLLASVFLFVAPIFLWISKRLEKSDTLYVPFHHDQAWTTSLRDKLHTGKKKVYFGDMLQFTYHRVYIRPYQKWIADFMTSPGLWFLKLKFQFNNGRTYIVTSEEKWRSAHYTVWENEEKIAEVFSEVNLEHVKKLLEQVVLHIDGHEYDFRAKTIKSKIELYKDGELIGEDVNNGGVHSLCIHPNTVQREHLPILLISWIIFLYRFK